MNELTTDTVAEMKEKLAKANLQLDDLNKDLNSQTAQVEQKKAEIKSKEQALDAEGLHLKQRQEQISRQIDELNSRLQAYESADNQLKSEEEGFNTAINQFNERLVRFQNEAAAFESTWDDYQTSLENGGDRDPQIEAQKSALDAENQALEQTNANLERQKKSLEDRRSALDNSYKSLEDLNNNIKAANDDLEKAVTIHNADFDAVAKEKQDLSADIESLKPLQAKKSELTALIDQLQKSIAAAEQGDKFDLADGDVVLPEALKAIIAGVAKQYFAQTNKRLVITSGLRTPAKQATAMYGKLARGEDIVALYHDKTAATEIKKAYDDNINKTPAEIIDAITKTITAQVGRKVYISRHLSGAAFDISISGMTEADKTAFRNIIKQSSDLSLIDNEAGPAHFHISSKMLSLRLSNLVTNLMPLNFLTANNRNAAALRGNMAERTGRTSINTFTRSSGNL